MKIFSHRAGTRRQRVRGTEVSLCGCAGRLQRICLSLQNGKCRVILPDRRESSPYLVQKKPRFSMC
jgi:hypothetical protein